MIRKILGKLLVFHIGIPNRNIVSFCHFIGLAQDEERAVCDCLNPFDVIAVELARHLFFGALPILGDVPEVRGDIVANNRKSKAEHRAAFDCPC